MIVEPATGATLGILTAGVIGYGLYTGGMRLNLGRFFRFTSVFLLLVAATETTLDADIKILAGALAKVLAA